MLRSLFVVFVVFVPAAFGTAPDVTVLPCGPDALAPRFSTVGGGPALSWIEPVPGATAGEQRLRIARYGGAGWGDARTVHAGDDIWSNWADFPALIEEADGSLLVHWLRRAGSQAYAYHIDLRRSRDGGTTWMPLGTLHDDATPTEHGFVSLVREGAGVRAFWLDGRAMLEADDDTEPGDMALRTALIGTTVGAGEILDDRVCECCNTAAAMTSEGPVVVYRDRSRDEIRDISIVRRVDDRWTAPTRVHADEWKMAACPVNGPAIVAEGRAVAVAWYTWAGSDGAVWRVAFSRDAGATFGAAASIDATMPLGRIDLLADGVGSVIVCWIDAGTGEGRIMLRRVAANGRMGDALVVARVDLARSTGFPRMARHKDGIVIAWTEDGSPGGVRAVEIIAASIPSPAPVPAGS